MITFNMILHVSCIMNEGSEGMGEQENNLCHTAKKNFRRSTVSRQFVPCNFSPSYVRLIVKQFYTLIILYCTFYILYFVHFLQQVKQLCTSFNLLANMSLMLVITHVAFLFVIVLLCTILNITP